MHMQAKLLLLIISICLLLPNGLSAESITQTISDSVPLNQWFTVYVDYNAPPGASDFNVLCSFFILKDNNVLIQRLSDSRTAADGTVSAELQILEPRFRRWNDYNAVSKCGTVSTVSVFSVVQKEDLAFGFFIPSNMRDDLEWWLDGENSLTIVLYGLGLLVILAIFFHGLG